jgi:hypothetical protein
MDHHDACGRSELIAAILAEFQKKHAASTKQAR